MADTMRVKIQTHGAESWKLSVRDVETGLLLPVMWGNRGPDGRGDVLEIIERNGVICLRADLIIEEIEIEGYLDIRSVKQMVRGVLEDVGAPGDQPPVEDAC